MGKYSQLIASNTLKAIDKHVEKKEIELPKLADLGTDPNLEYQSQLKGDEPWVNPLLEDSGMNNLDLFRTLCFRYRTDEYIPTESFLEFVTESI